MSSGLRYFQTSAFQKETDLPVARNNQTLQKEAKDGTNETFMLEFSHPDINTTCIWLWVSYWLNCFAGSWHDPIRFDWHWDICIPTFTSSGKRWGNFKASVYVRSSRATFKVATLSHFIHGEPVVSLLHPQSVTANHQMPRTSFKRFFFK